MIYDHEGLEARYDETMQGINEVLDELHANHDHITPENVVELGHISGRLKAVLSMHGARLSLWEKDSS